MTLITVLYQQQFFCSQMCYSSCVLHAYNYALNWFALTWSRSGVAAAIATCKCIMFCPILEFGGVFVLHMFWQHYYCKDQYGDNDYDCITAMQFCCPGFRQSWTVTSWKSTMGLTYYPHWSAHLMAHRCLSSCSAAVITSTCSSPPTTAAPTAASRSSMRVRAPLAVVLNCVQMFLEGGLLDLLFS